MFTKSITRLTTFCRERRSLFVPTLALFLCYMAAGALARYSYVSSSHDALRNQRLRSITGKIFDYSSENYHTQLDFKIFVQNPTRDFINHFKIHESDLSLKQLELEKTLNTLRDELDPKTISLFKEIKNHQAKTVQLWSLAISNFNTTRNLNRLRDRVTLSSIDFEVSEFFQKLKEMSELHTLHVDAVATQNRNAVDRRLLLYGILATCVFFLLLYIIVSSIRRERTLVNQLVQNEKLSSLGQMSAGIAHELNTPLMYIQGYAGRIRSTLRKSKIELPSLSEYLSEVDEGIERMSLIIGHLREFARKDDKNKKPFSPEKSISRAFDFFNEQLAQQGIDVQLLLDAGGMKILGTANRFEQIFINLISNARDALQSMPENRNKYIRVVCQSVDRNIAIRFEDNGPGIPQEKFNLVFEPFYTTKPMGSGTGLGLSIVHEIVNEHRGKITLNSNPRTGTVFTIVVPGVEP